MVSFDEIKDVCDPVSSEQKDRLTVWEGGRGLQFELMVSFDGI